MNISISDNLKAFFLLFLLFHLIHADEYQLSQLEDQIKLDLKYINVPPKKWIKYPDPDFSEDVLDVAIIGGGMAGLTSAFALIKNGVTNIKIFDENCEGCEGAWIRCARMKNLRSDKFLMGPAIGLPNLTFRAWYVALYGMEAWKAIRGSPTEEWSRYLRWYRHVLNFPIKSNYILKNIEPLSSILKLTFHENGEPEVVYTRKVVLATGRGGFGGVEIPDCIQALPKKFYAHTNESISPSFFEKKRIAIIGCGSSAFDLAAVALENNAAEVTILIRRQTIPTVNKFSQFGSIGILRGFYGLSDDRKCQYFAEAFKFGTPPNKEAIDRIKNFSNLQFVFNADSLSIKKTDDVLVITSNEKKTQCDFIVLATGYAVDGSKQRELNDFFQDILLWVDKAPKALVEMTPKLGKFPYLGPDFQFQEKELGQAPFLRNIYCFNYGAFLSHGLISGDVMGISIGASRLAEGIAADFFKEAEQKYFESICEYDTPLFDPADIFRHSFSLPLKIPLSISSTN